MCDDAEESYFVYTGKGPVPKGIRHLKIAECVQEIPDRCFQRNFQLRTVDFSQAHNLCVIGKEAFLSCIHLTMVDLSCTRVHTIRESAFAHCMELQTVTLSPITLKSLERAAFRYCTELQSISFLQAKEASTKERCDFITEVPDYCFYRCTALKSVHLSSTVESIGHYAFTMCESLRHISIGDNSEDAVKKRISIGLNALFGCKQLKQHLEDAVVDGQVNAPEFDKDVWVYDGRQQCSPIVAHLVIASHVQILKPFLFLCGSSGYYLQSLILHDQVREIHSNLFQVCPMLTDVSIPARVQYFGDAFSGATLKRISISKSNGDTTFNLPLALRLKALYPAATETTLPMNRLVHMYSKHKITKMDLLEPKSQARSLQVWQRETGLLEQVADEYIESIRNLVLWRFHNDPYWFL